MNLQAFGRIFFEDPMVGRFALDSGALLLAQYDQDFWDCTMLDEPASKPLAAVVQLVNGHVIDVPVSSKLMRDAHSLIAKMVDNIRDE